MEAKPGRTMTFRREGGGTQIQFWRRSGIKKFRLKFLYMSTRCHNNSLSVNFLTIIRAGKTFFFCEWYVMCGAGMGWVLKINWILLFKNNPIFVQPLHDKKRKNSIHTQQTLPRYQPRILFSIKFYGYPSYILSYISRATTKNHKWHRQPSEQFSDAISINNAVENYRMRLLLAFRALLLCSSHAVWWLSLSLAIRMCGIFILWHAGWYLMVFSVFVSSRWNDCVRNLWLWGGFDWK
jgi:hypothetical protein